MNVTQNKQLSQIASAYLPPAHFIADKVLPKTRVPSIEYQRQKPGRDWRLRNTGVGKFDTPEDITFDSSLEDGTLKGHALTGKYSVEDVNKQMQQGGNGMDIYGATLQQVLLGMALAREKDVADLVFADASYSATMRETIAGNNQFNDFENSSPISVVAEAAEKFVYGPPNALVMGSQVFAKLMAHPDVLEAYKSDISHGAGATAGQKGMLNARQMASAFGVEHVFVGFARYNTANPGADESLGRMWGKHMALLTVGDVGTPVMPMPVFGYTGAIEERTITHSVGDYPLNKIGAAGAGEITVQEYREEVILNPDAGYFFKNAVA